MRKTISVVLAAAVNAFASGCSSSPDARLACEMNPEIARPQSAGTRVDGWGSNSWGSNGWMNNGWGMNSWGNNSWGANSWGQNGGALGWVALNESALAWDACLDGYAGNELVVRAPDGTIRAGDALVGTAISGVLADGTAIDLVIDSFARSDDGKLAYYSLTANGANLCGDGVKGMFLPGVWDASGARHDALTAANRELRVSYSCMTGVLAKCMAWGYAPWEVGADLHQTCTRLARADYCGNGVSYTKNGTRIDVFDTGGIQTPVGDPSYPFEAGWGPGGAVCVSHTRYDAQTPEGKPVLPSCWSGLPRCQTFAEAEAMGATMGNASKPQPRLFCD